MIQKGSKQQATSSRQASQEGRKEDGSRQQAASNKQQAGKPRGVERANE
jgi:hypothetical protein